MQANQADLQMRLAAAEERAAVAEKKAGENKSEGNKVHFDKKETDQIDKFDGSKNFWATSLFECF